jgi:hypothetical protein
LFLIRVRVVVPVGGEVRPVGAAAASAALQAAPPLLLALAAVAIASLAVCRRKRLPS